MDRLRSKTFASCFVAVCTLFTLSLRAAAAEIEVTDDITYGKAGEQSLQLDIAHPKSISQPAPCIVFIHGGGWAGGNRKGHYNRMKKAAEEGFVSATISYRLVKDGQNRWPAQIEDCKRAIRWLRAHADDYKIDPARIGAIGDSAGAHLSMLLGTMDEKDGFDGEGGHSSKVQAVVGYYGPTDLTAEYPQASRGIVRNFIGGSLDERADDYRRASPITYVNAGDAPMLLFHGTKDELVPYDQAFQMATALTQAGVPGRVEILLGHRHGWGGETAQHTERATMEFFRSVLKLESADQK